MILIQATIQVAADGGLKDELNDIKNLLKAMNDNLDKILHHKWRMELMAFKSYNIIQAARVRQKTDAVYS